MAESFGCLRLIHERLLNSQKSMLFMRRAKGQSVCLLWKPWLWMAGGLIDLHYHVLLFNPEGHMHKNRWWPINLQPPRRSASAPARRISKFTLLKNHFLLPSLCCLEFWSGSAGLSAAQQQTNTLLFTNNTWTTLRLKYRFWSVIVVLINLNSDRFWLAVNDKSPGPCSCLLHIIRLSFTVYSESFLWRTFKTSVKTHSP